jgi:hypothetical protein
MAEPPEADRRFALVLANATYDDGGLARLVAPAQDAEALAGVLEHPAVCGFDVTRLVDARSEDVAQVVEAFFAERGRDDLLLLYFSCHGIKDEFGRLYFAARNTRRDRLRSTAVPASFVNDVLLSCRSRRKVLILDCCYSGAFAKGMQVKSDPAVHTGEHFDARGLVVLTASDSTQYAFEGDIVRGTDIRSVFTANLVAGLETGDADKDNDGWITVDDIHEYVRVRMVEQAPFQSPRKWEFDVQGRIVIGRSPHAIATLAGPPAGSVPNTAPGSSVPAASSVRTAFPRQPAWWAATALFLLTAVALTGPPIVWLVPWVNQMVSGDVLPAKSAIVVGALVAALAWGLAYAAVETVGRARAGLPFAWYSLHLRLTQAYAEFARPPSAGRFLSALVAAVPLNVFMVSFVASGLAALAYRYLSGSEGRDHIFVLASYVLTCAGVVAFVTGALRRFAAVGAR